MIDHYFHSHGVGYLNGTSLLRVTVVLTMKEKVFMVDHYFHSRGVGCLNGPSLLHVTNEFRERFQKTLPSNCLLYTSRCV